MHATHYGRQETEAMTGRRVVGEARLRRLCASTVAKLTTEAERADMMEQLYYRDYSEALKCREPFPEPYTARHDFEHATTKALARLLYAVPPGDWCSVARYLQQQISRKAGLCSYLEHYLEDRPFPF